MEILRTIALYADSKDMPFLVIGGHAVNIYGISRQTGDLDLLTPLRSKPFWQELFRKLRYTEFQSDDKFSRFEPSTKIEWPVDLMYVDDTTFSMMQADAMAHAFGLTDVSVVSSKHLIVLKIHALKSLQSHRMSKDYLDVLGILQTNLSLFVDSELEEVCSFYGPKDLYERLKNDLERV